MPCDIFFVFFVSFFIFLFGSDGCFSTVARRSLPSHTRCVVRRSAKPSRGWMAEDLGATEKKNCRNQPSFRTRQKGDEPAANDASLYPEDPKP